MADTPPATPTETPPQNPNLAVIAAAMNPYATVNLDEAKKLKEQYAGELSTTRGALSQASGRRDEITARNLRAIDESIQGLKDARTGTYGLDPAVTAALAAGLLKPSGGGGFLAELGQGMANAAPVIAGLQTKDRDSYALLAELQRKRGDFEAEPIKDDMTELRAREKLEMANLKEAEKALTRAPPGTGPAAKEKIDLAKKKLIEGIIARAQTDADKATTGMMHADIGKTLSITDKQKIQKYLALEAVKDHNRRTKEGSDDWIDPAQFAMTEPEIAEAVALADKAVPDDKGQHRDYNEYLRTTTDKPPKSKPEWEAQNAAHKTVTVKRAEELLASENALDSTLATTATLKEVAEKLLTHPGLNGITGNLRGSESYPGMGNDEVSAIALYKQLKSIEFLKALPNMKGFGQLTEAEGAKLQASQNALERRMSTDGFRAELQAIVDRANKLEARLRERHAEKERKAGASGGAKTPTPEHIEMLKKDPSLAEFFDKTYGAGAAAKVLGQ